MSPSPTTSRCPTRILGWLPWYPDGLSDEERGRVEAHVSACAGCRRELAVLQGEVAV